MSLVTVADYELLTGTDVPAEQEAQLQALLDAASAAIQRATGQTIEKARTTDEVHCLEQPRATLMVDEVPIIEADPDDTLVVLAPDGSVEPRANYTVLADSGELKHCDCHPWWMGVYLVTYSHGYDPVPPELQAFICGAVQAVWGVPAGVAQQSVGSYSVTYRDAPGIAALADLSGGILDRYTVSDPA